MIKFKQIANPVELDFYQIYTDHNGVTRIHLLGYMYRNESDDYWGNIECTGIDMPLAEFANHYTDIDEFVNECYEGCTQYQDDMDKWHALHTINHYFDGKNAQYFLPFNQVTINTPCGTYVSGKEVDLRAVRVLEAPHRFHGVYIQYDIIGDYQWGYYENWHWYIEVYTSIGTNKTHTTRKYFKTLDKAKEFIKNY